MALDLHGFTSGEDKFEGLYRLGDDIQRNKQLAEQKAYRQQQDKDRDEARRNSQSQFFGNFLDKKNHITGTAYDNNTNALLGKALAQAYQQSAAGAQTADIMMSVQPLVDQVNQYDSKAKEYVQNRDKILDFYSKQKGYNMPAIRELLDKETFYKTDPQTGEHVLDVDNADPTLKKGLESINANHLHDITNGEGVGEWVKAQPFDARDENILETDKHGNKTTHRLNIKAANWEMPVPNGKGNYDFVPKREDGGVDEKGNKAYILDDKVFKNLMSDQSNRDYVMGELKLHLDAYKEHTGEDIPVHSPQGEKMARGIAYKMLEGKTSGFVATADKSTLSAPQIRLNLTGSPYAPSAASSTANANVNEVYDSIQQDLKDMANNGIGYLPAENIKNTTAKDYVMTEANKSKKRLFKPSDLRVVTGGDGTTRVFTNKGEFVNYIDKTEIDRAGNKAMGTKTQQKIVGRKNEGTPSKSKDPLGIL